MSVTNLKDNPRAQAKLLIKRYLDDEELANSEYATLHAVADSHGQILQNVIHMKWFEGELTDFLKPPVGGK